MPRRFSVASPGVAVAGVVRVAFSGRHEVHYKNGDRNIVFGREPLFRDEETFGYEIYPPAEPPFTSAGDATAIFEDIRDALAAMGTRAIFPGEPL